jgi:hypothetical protein
MNGETMRKLLLGIGLMAAGRLLGRGAPVGLRGLFSLRSLAAIIAGAAASELLNRHKTQPAPPPPAPPASP